MKMRRESENVRNFRLETMVQNEENCEICRKSQLLSHLLGEAKSFPADCGSSPTIPDWLDLQKYRKAQAIFHRHFLSILLINLMGLFCLLTVETILRVLVFTGKSSTSLTAYKRYLSTINHLREWYSSDVFDKGSSAFKSIQLVRRIHIASHTAANNSQKLLASQTDMVVTQWAFFGLVLTDGPKLGIHLTKEEEEAFVHFWKIIGYLLGIHDKYNIASGSLEEVKINCHALAHKFIIPGLVHPPKEFHQMANAMLTGAKMILPVIDPIATVEFTKHIFGIKCDTKKLSGFSGFTYNFMMWNFGVLMQLPVINVLVRVYENFLLSFALFVCNTLPIVSSYNKWTKTKIMAIKQDMMALFRKVSKGILMLFHLESS